MSALGRAARVYTDNVRRLASILCLAAALHAGGPADAADRVIRQIKADEKAAVEFGEDGVEQLSSSPADAAKVATVALGQVEQATRFPDKWRKLVANLRKIAEGCVKARPDEPDSIQAAACARLLEIRLAYAVGGAPPDKDWTAAIELLDKLHKMRPSDAARRAVAAAMIEADRFGPRLDALAAAGRKATPSDTIYGVPLLRARCDAVKAAAANEPAYRARKKLKALLDDWEKLDNDRLFNDAVHMANTMPALKVTAEYRLATRQVGRGVDTLEFGYPSGGRWKVFVNPANVSDDNRDRLALVDNLLARIYRPRDGTLEPVVEILAYDFHTFYDDGENNVVMANNVKQFARGRLKALLKGLREPRILWKPHAKSVNRVLRSGRTYQFVVTGLGEHGQRVRHEQYIFRGKNFTFCIHVRERTDDREPDTEAVLDSFRFAK